MANETPTDAIELLKADHRKVEDLFEEFENAKTGGQKSRLVKEICNELKIHTQIEEEIFYPAILPKIDEATVDEGYVEHDGAKILINDLLKSEPTDRFYDEKVKVLSEDIRHHVQEEERWLKGMFAQSRRTDLNMDELGAALLARREELLKKVNTKAGLPPAVLATLKR